MNIQGKIKKGTVAIYVLAIMLVTAGYWNYVSTESKTLETVSMNEDTEKSSDEHLGDATLVSNSELIKEEEKEVEKKETEETKKEEKDDYFEESKLSRDTMYSQTLTTYKEMLNNSNVSEEQKTIVTQEITKLNQEKNAIMISENLISTKGFKDCVIFVNIDSISVIIKSEELKTEEIAQIQNVIAREMNSKVENIHIMTKK